MGYRLKIEYNAAQLKPVSVNNASAFPGNFNDSIGQKDGEFSVVWNSTQSNFSNGQLMSVRFEVITASACESEIKISYIQADTFDEAYKDVVFDCREGSVYLNCDHSKSSTQVISPTCTDNEFTVYTCTICGYSYKTEKSGSALGHDWTNRTVVESATCVKTGFEKVSCSRCKIEKTILIPKTEHEWDSGKITKEATCTEEGIRTYTCSLCHENRAESLAKKPHTTTKTTEKATLNSDGKIETKCSVCGEVIDSTAILRPTTIKLSASAFTYDGKVKTPGVVVKDADGKTVSNSNYTVTYSNGRKNVGKYAVKITFKGDYSGTKILYFTIKPKPTNMKLSANSYTYDGKVKKPGVTVKDANGKTISKSLYTVSYAKGRKSVGKYAVKVSFKGNCYEAKILYFTIKPKPTSISAVKSASKGFSLKWKKQAVQTSGYEIQYAVDSKFTKEAKIVTVPKNTTTSKKIAKIKGKKKYYIRVRTYKLVKINGKSTRIYSGWSKVKTVKTK